MNYKRKSVDQKRLEGTDRADRDGQNTAGQAGGFEYSIPAWLDAKAKKWAKTNLPKFIEEGLIGETDLTTFFMAAASIGEYLNFSELIKKEELKTDPDLYLVSKLSIQRSKAQKSFLDFARELGLTPRSRSVFGVASESGRGDVFEEF